MHGSERDVTLRGESARVLEATRLSVEKVSKTNPARNELLAQIHLIEESIRSLEDCSIPEQKHGYLGFVMTDLFEGGEAELICGGRVYTVAMVKKEFWEERIGPALSGIGGFLYLNYDDEIVFRQATWIS
jgi:hypothetical protein